MRLRELVNSGKVYLHRRNISEPLRNAEFLLGHAAGVSRVDIYRDNDDVSLVARARYARALVRRGTGIPLQYVTGIADFYGRTFRVKKKCSFPDRKPNCWSRNLCVC